MIALASGIAFAALASVQLVSVATIAQRFGLLGKSSLSSFSLPRLCEPLHRWTVIWLLPACALWLRRDATRIAMAMGHATATENASAWRATAARIAIPIARTSAHTEVSVWRALAFASLVFWEMTALWQAAAVVMAHVTTQRFASAMQDGVAMTARCSSFARILHARAMAVASTGHATAPLATQGQRARCRLGAAPQHVASMACAIPARRLVSARWVSWGQRAWHRRRHARISAATTACA